MEPLSRRQIISLSGAAAVLAVGSQAAGAQKAESDDALREATAKGSSQAEAALFGEAKSEEELASYTSHFNFDNRRFPGAPNPPTSNKYRCAIECKLDNGDIKWLANDDLRTVFVGELDVLEVYAKRYRVVECRFWWKLRPAGRNYSSNWVKATSGYYIVYAFLTWVGENNYERPIYFYEDVIS